MKVTVKSFITYCESISKNLTQRKCRLPLSLSPMEQCISQGSVDQHKWEAHSSAKRA